MGIFDNAKSITFNDKEVKSITVDGGVIYEIGDSTHNMTVNVYGEGGTEQPLEGAVVTLNGSSTFSETTGADGTCVFDIPYGNYSASVSVDGYDTESRSWTFDENHTSFALIMTPSSQVTTQ